MATAAAHPALHILCHGYETAPGYSGYFPDDCELVFSSRDGHHVSKAHFMIQAAVMMQPCPRTGAVVSVINDRPVFVRSSTNTCAARSRIMLSRTAMRLRVTEIPWTFS